MDLPLIAAIAAREDAEINRLRRIAASGTAGCVAAREAMQRVRHEQLAGAVRCTANGWRGVGAR